MESIKEDGDAELGRNLIPYEFQWIEEIGSNMIQEIEIYRHPIKYSKKTLVLKKRFKGIEKNYGRKRYKMFWNK